MTLFRLVISVLNSDQFQSSGRIYVNSLCVTLLPWLLSVAIYIYIYTSLYVYMCINIYVSHPREIEMAP